MLKLLALLPFALLFASCSQSPAPLSTVQDFDPNRYDGEWHEVARLPNRFEEGLVAAKAIYGVGLDAPIAVKNLGLKSDGRVTTIEGSARVVGPGKLKVRFNPLPANLFPGDYWILWIDSGYQQAIVGSPSRNYLWLLSKDPLKTVADFVEPLQLMKAQGFEIHQLIENTQRLLPAQTLPQLVRGTVPNDGAA